MYILSFNKSLLPTCRGLSDITSMKNYTLNMCPRAHDAVAEWRWGQTHSLIILCRNFTFILIITSQYSPFHKLREEGSKTLNKSAYGYIAGVLHSRDLHEFYIYSIVCILHGIKIKIEGRCMAISLLYMSKQKLHWAILSKHGQFYVRLLQ